MSGFFFFLTYSGLEIAKNIFHFAPDNRMKTKNVRFSVTNRNRQNWVILGNKFWLFGFLDLILTSRFLYCVNSQAWTGSNTKNYSIQNIPKNARSQRIRPHNSILLLISYFKAVIKHQLENIGGFHTCFEGNDPESISRTLLMQMSAKLCQS